LALPGIGPYSAGAIASIAFGLPEPIVDGNVVRVLCRLFALRGDPARAPLKAELWRIARELTTADKPAEFNQSLMELGARICTPTSPRCTECPVSRQCAARAQGIERELPELKRRTAPTFVRTAAALVEQAGALLLRRVPDGATRWAGLWVVPFAELGPSEDPLDGSVRALEELGIVGQAQALTRELRHSITRYRIRLSVVRCSMPARTKLPPHSGFFTPQQIQDLPLPSVHTRLVSLR